MNCVSCVVRRLTLQGMSSTGVRALSSTSVMRGKLDGKVAIVTASTEGIGFGIAHNLASHGASVMISSRKVGNSKHTVRDCHLCC